MFRIHRPLIFAPLALFALTLFAVQPARAVTVAFDATHEVVCSCECGTETQTYEWEPGFDCADLNGISCEYNEGSTSTLEDCVKTTQKKKRVASPVPGGMTAAPIQSSIHEQELLEESPAPPPVSTGGTTPEPAVVIARPIGPITPRPFPYLKSFNIPTGAQYLAWLDGISQNLFANDFVGLVLDATPNAVGTYSGFTAWPQQRFSLAVASIQDHETILGYVDPDSGLVFDLQVVWLTGTISAGASSVTTGSVAVTATYVSDPSQKLTGLYPLGANYPFAPSVSGATSGGIAPIGSVEFADEADAILGLPDVGEAAVAAEDPCAGCYTTANKAIDRMKRDYKRCLKWSTAGAIVGGAVGLLGGNPWTVIGGAVLGGAVVAGECSDEALDTYADIIEDFCACLSANDCAPHSACD